MLHVHLSVYWWHQTRWLHTTQNQSRTHQLPPGHEIHLCSRLALSGDTECDCRQSSHHQWDQLRMHYFWRWHSTALRSLWRVKYCWDIHAVPPLSSIEPGRGSTSQSQGGIGSKMMDHRSTYSIILDNSNSPQIKDYQFTFIFINQLHSIPINH